MLCWTYNALNARKSPRKTIMDMCIFNTMKVGKKSLEICVEESKLGGIESNKCRQFQNS